jgi:hypothetical protein
MSYSSRLDIRRVGRSLIRLLALFLTLAFTAPTLFAQERDQDKRNDPTGAWLVTDTGAGSDGQPTVVATFFKDGTVSGDTRFDIGGETTFSPEHGVWKKTGARTFTANFVALEYNHDFTLFAIFKVLANFRLNGSDDQYDAEFVVRETLTNGHVNTGSGTSHGVRITLEPPPLVGFT